MKKPLLLFLACAICSLLGVAAGVWLCGKEKPVGYVRLDRLYKEYNQRQEMERKLMALGRNRQAVLDSLQRASSTPGDSAARQHSRLQEYFAQDAAQTAERYQALLWQQLNVLIKEYGYANGYEMVFGADGSGAVMHADSSLDITAEVLQFINQQPETSAPAAAQ